MHRGLGLKIFREIKAGQRWRTASNQAIVILGTDGKRGVIQFQLYDPETWKPTDVALEGGVLDVQDLMAQVDAHLEV